MLTRPGHHQATFFCELRSPAGPGHLPIADLPAPNCNPHAHAMTPAFATLAALPFSPRSFSPHRRRPPRACATAPPAVSPHLHVTRTPAGVRGLSASNRIPPSHVIARLPLTEALVVSVDDSQAAAADAASLPFPPAVWLPLTYWNASDWDLKLVALLLYHALVEKDMSPWASYVHSLPTHHELTTAADLDHDALLDTQYPPLVDAVECYQYRADAEFVRMRAALPLFKRSLLSRENFDWAMKIVHSRAFSIPPGGFAAGSTRAGLRNRQNAFNGSRNWPSKFALVPVLDMTNHGSSSDLANFRYDDQAGCFELVAGLRGYEKDDQVLVSYGDLTNDDLYLLYGFVQAGNPHDVFEVEDVIDWVAEHHSVREWNLHDAKLRLLERVGLCYEGRKFHLSVSQIDRDLVAALRILLADVNDFRRARAMVEFEQPRHELSVGGMKREVPSGWFEPLTATNERSVWRQIESQCIRMLQEFPTSIEFDEEMIILHAASSVPSDPVHANSLLFRVEKKRILRAAALLAKEHCIKLDIDSERIESSEVAPPSTDLWADVS